MPKRRATSVIKEDDSSLTPPPDDLLGTTLENYAGDGSPDAEPPTKKRKATRVQKGTDIPEPGVSQKPKSGRRKTKVVTVESELVEEVVDAPDATPKKRRSRKQEVKVDEAQLDADVTEIKQQVKSRRKSKAQKERELVEMPLAARTVGSKLLIGAHVSAAGGVHQAVLNSVHIGANAFALFIKSQRKWENPPLQDEHCELWHAHCKTHVYDQTSHIVPHGSYLVNLAHTSKQRTEQAYNSFIDDLKRCERLGISLYNFHPGNDQNGDRPKAITHLANNINRAIAETSKVVVLLETMATRGTTIGSTFEDLRDTISQVTNKQRVGVCMDTAHVFAAGYDIRTPEAFKKTLDQFKEIVGFKYLRAMHLNDSKAPFGSGKDLHANIGTGFLGLRAFHNVANEPRFAGLPLVLETPIEVRDEDGNLVKDDKGKEKEDKGIWATEIKLLESLVGMDVESEEFLELEKRLARKGEPERKRLLDVVERKKAKDAKKAEGPKRKKKARKGVVDGSDSSGESSPLSDIKGESEGE